MTAVQIEVAPDPAAAEGGRAVILLKGLARAPATAVFRIEPVDETLLDEDVSGWPTGDREPLEVRVATDGVQLVVGADVVDAPLLQPGTPVTISVPSENLRGDLRWPSIPVSVVPRRRPAVVTVAQHLAARSPQLPANENASPLLPSLITDPDAEADADIDASVEAVTAPDGAPAPLLARNDTPQSAAVADDDAIEVEAVAAPNSERDDGPRAALASLQPHRSTLPANMALALPAQLPPSAGPAPARRRSPLAPLAIASAVACGLTALAFFGPWENVADALRRAQGDHGAPNLTDAFSAGAVSPRGRAGAVDVEAALRLAEASLHGLNKPVDRDEAKYWLSKALGIAVGDDQIKWALTQLGSIYAKPASGTPDYGTARALWSIAAAQGDAVALCFLAKVEEKGLGGPADMKAAAEHREKSLSLGGCKSAEHGSAGTRK